MNFYIGKTIKEWKTLIRNTIIIILITPFTFYFSKIIGIVLSLISLIFASYCFLNLRKEYAFIKDRFFKNGQIKWVKTEISRINHVGQYKVIEYNRNGTIRYEYTYSGDSFTSKKKSDIKIIKSQDENGKLLDFTFQDSLFYNYNAKN